MKENLYRTNSLSENHYGRGPERDRHFYHGWTSTKELQSLRGHILAAYGYDVIIPEAINHGERGLIDYEENPKAYYHFGILFYKCL